ncbi:TPA: hypothetical protein ACFRHE_002098 [Neisseria lactamica]
MPSENLSDGISRIPAPLFENRQKSTLTGRKNPPEIIEFYCARFQSSLYGCLDF